MFKSNKSKREIHSVYANFMDVPNKDRDIKENNEKREKGREKDRKRKIELR